MIDHYTKFILTVIAAALIALAWQNAVLKSELQPDMKPEAQLHNFQRVQICDESACMGLMPVTRSVGDRRYTGYVLPVSIEK